MKSILYISQFYPPESIAAAFRAYDHASIWANNGQSVTILTAWPNYPKGQIFDGYETRLLAKTDNNGITIFRSKIKAIPNRSLIGRIVNGSSFLFYGIVNSLFNKKRIGKDYDIVLASTGTIFAGYVGLVYSKLIKVPLVVEFRDITFEQMVATGTPRNSWKVRLMKFLELHLAHKANHIVVLTSGFKDKFTENKIPESKITVIPNGADIKEMKHVHNNEKINLGYFGTMGISQDVPYTLQIAQFIREVTDNEIDYLLIGEGAAKNELAEIIDNNTMEFVTLLPGMPKEELEKYYSNCDFTFVSLQRADEFKATIPSKIFQSLARGVPVIFVGPDGEAAEIIRNSNTGLVLSGSDEDNERMIRGFFDDDWRKKLDVMRKNAFKLIELEYSRSLLANRMLEVLINNSKAKEQPAHD